MTQKEKDIKAVLSSDFVFDQEGVYSDNVGVFAPRAACVGRFFSDYTLISQEYLSNFENSYKYGAVTGTAVYMQNRANILALYEKQYEEDVSDVIHLPKARAMKVSLQRALFERASSRFFDGSPLSLQMLSDFLFYSAASLVEENVNVGDSAVKRHKMSYPSGGGMYSIKLYLAVYAVDSLESAIYIYQPVSHTLKKFSAIAPLDSFIITKRYNSSTGSYDDIENFSPCVLCLFVNDFSRARLKYGELSLLTALIDCGCLAENCSLAASALNLHFCLWAGFKKSEGEKALCLDGLEKHLILSALLGSEK